MCATRWTGTSRGAESCRLIRADLEDLSRLCREQEPVRLPDGVRQRIEGLLEEPSTWSRTRSPGRARR